MFLVTNLYLIDNLLGSLAIGKTIISDLLESEDVLKTANGLKALGVDIYKNGDEWFVHGVGIGGFVNQTTL